jgi:cytochrome c551/c552
MRFVLALCAAIGLVVTTATASAGTGEDLIAKEKCNKCHTATTTKKAPSFAAVAEKYKGKPEATAALVDMLKTGGKDDHPKVAASDADLKAVVGTVLSSK